MFRKLMPILVALFAASPAFATTYYVDFSAGDNSKNGLSQDNAWKNLPGTCTAATSNVVSCTFVTATGWASLAAGDTIKIKSGTTHDNNDGGRLYITSTHYANTTLANPITIQRDTTWGTGTVTIDGANISLPGAGWGLIHIRNIGGIVIDGVAGVTDAYNGFTVQNSQGGAIHSYPSTATEYASHKIQYVSFSGNGTNFASTGSATDGAIYLRGNHPAGGEISWVKIDGGGNSFQGISVGDTARRVNGLTISNAVVTNHSPSGTGSGCDDSGIGVKAQNSVVTVDNVTSYNNTKGGDFGEQTSTDTWDIAYTIKNSTFYSNVSNGCGMAGTGLGFSVKGTARTGSATFTLINNVIYNNASVGTKMYAGPFTSYIVHNVWDNNDGNLMAGPESNTPADNTTIRVYQYNNAFYKPSGDWNTTPYHWRQNISDFNTYSNYNSYVQTGSEVFNGDGSFAWYGATFAYGANGPGHASGNWYNYYGGSASAPTNGALGHYQQDANSKGTGATDTTEPPFTDRTNHDYTLTSAYAGTDLSGQAWYTAAMGLDRNGNTRTNWDIGAYEYGGVDTTPNAFSLGADNTAVAISTLIYAGTSANVAGITDNCSIAISGTGCQYQINGAGDWLTSGDNVSLNDNVAVRTTSANAYSTSVSCVLTLGGVSDTWAAVTKAATVEEGTAKKSTFSGLIGGWR